MLKCGYTAGGPEIIAVIVKVEIMIIAKITTAIKSGVMLLVLSSLLSMLPAHFVVEF